MKAKNGSGLIFAVVLLFVILGMVITLSSVTVLETKMSQKTKSSIGAFYNSESGVEWALNKIATSPSTTTVGSINCPFDGCKVYFLGADGKVLADAVTIDQVKAVRSVGTQGGETQRAIEAAVASGEGGCYVDYSLGTGLSVGTSCGAVGGFTIKRSAGKWGRCGGSDNYTTYYDRAAYFNPPGGACPSAWGFKDLGEAYVCCM